MTRLSCGVSIALWLSLAATGTLAGQQEPAGAAKGVESVPAALTPGQRETPQPPSEETPPGVPANTEKAAAETPPPPAAPEKKPRAASIGGARRRHKRTARVSSTGPKKVVVREGGAREPAAQIAPGIAPEEARRLRQDAVELMGSADGELKQLTGRNLDARQQETVGQIHNYLAGARTALKEGDVGRASTLAQKAHLLAEDMAGH